MSKVIIVNKFVTFPTCALLAVLASCNAAKKSDQTNKKTTQETEEFVQIPEKFDKELNGKFKKFNEREANKPENAFEQAKESMQDARVSLAPLTVKQKELALEAVDLSLNELDGQIDAFEDWYADRKSTMSERTKKGYQISITTLKQQREIVEEWEDKLKESTPDTWDKIKEGFSTAYTSMTNSWNSLFESSDKGKNYLEAAINRNDQYKVIYFDPDYAGLTKNLAGYSVEQKEQAMEDIDDNLSALDEQIEDYEKWCSESKDKLVVSTYDRHKNALQSMKAHRKSLQAFYDKLDKSTPDTWDKVKTGFSESYKSVAGAINKLFSSDDYIVALAKDNTIKELDQSLGKLDQLIIDYRKWYSKNKMALEKREFYYSVLTDLEIKRDSLKKMREEVEVGNEADRESYKQKLNSSYNSILKSWNTFVESEKKSETGYPKDNTKL